MIHQNRSMRQIFAKNLRKHRLEKGISQEALADLAGLHRPYIGSIDRGERNISIDNIERLAQALDCQVVDLLKGDK